VAVFYVKQENGHHARHEVAVEFVGDFVQSNEGVNAGKLRIFSYELVHVYFVFEAKSCRQKYNVRKHDAQPSRQLTSNPGGHCCTSQVGAV